MRRVARQHPRNQTCKESAEILGNPKEDLIKGRRALRTHHCELVCLRPQRRLLREAGTPPTLRLTAKKPISSELAGSGADQGKSVSCDEPDESLSPSLRSRRALHHKPNLSAEKYYCVHSRRFFDRREIRKSCSRFT